MSFWKNHPGIKLVIPFMLGIITSVELELNSNGYLIYSLLFLCLSAFSFYFSSYQTRKKIGFIFFISLFFAGFTYSSFRTEKYSPLHFSHSQNRAEYYVVTISDNLQEKENSYKTVLKMNQINEDLISPCTGRVLAYFKKDSLSDKLKYGDKLLIKNNLNEIEAFRNPNQFDYRNYLNLNQINFQVFLRSGDYEVLTENSGNSIFAFSQRMRQKLYGYLQNNGVEGKQLKVASALLLGYRENLDKDLVKSYASAGAMHVLAVSGLHVGILYLLLTRIFSFFKRIKKGKYILALVIILSLWFYAIMTGLSASVMRATTMFSFIVIGNELLNRKTSIYNTLAVSAILLMIINPYILYQVGFQLSYVAVVGIVYLQPKLNRLVYSRFKIVKAVWAITCVSLAAQIATFPLSLHYFHQFPTYFFISNLVVIPAAFCVFYLGVFLFVSAPFGGFSLVVGKLINGIVWVLNQAVYWTEDLSMSLVEEIEFTIFETYFLYGIIVTILYALYSRRIQQVRFSLLLILLFCGLQVAQQYQFTQQKYLTFYSINKSSALEYTVGNNTYFISSEELQKDWSMMLFNVNNHWNSHNILNKTYLNIDSLPADTIFENLAINEGVVFIEDVAIQVFNSNLILNMEPHYLWIKNNNLKGLIRYLKNNKPKNIVFDSSVPRYKLDYYLPYIDSTMTQVICLDKKFYKVNLE